MRVSVRYIGKIVGVDEADVDNAIDAIMEYLMEHGIDPDISLNTRTGRIEVEVAADGRTPYQAGNAGFHLIDVAMREAGLKRNAIEWQSTKTAPVAAAV